MHYFKDAVGNVYAYRFVSSAGEGQTPISEAEGLALAVGSAAVPNVAAQEREWRDGELSSLLWLRERHRDQSEIGSDTTLTKEQFNELLVYMQSLRDWPQSPDFPDIEQRPVPPAWIVEQTQ